MQSYKKNLTYKKHFEKSILKHKKSTNVFWCYMKENQIIIYQPDNTVQLEVRMENETVWLNRQQLSVLFDRDIKTIGKHINNALKQELKGFPTVAKFATVQIEGSRSVLRNVEYYNLDVILSVGFWPFCFGHFYCVKSHC